jgi:hypothetical protein
MVLEPDRGSDMSDASDMSTLGRIYPTWNWHRGSGIQWQYPTWSDISDEIEPTV